MCTAQYGLVLGGIRDQGKKAPCAFSNSSFHAFIDYHTLYVTVECSTQNGSQYALMRSVVYMLPETGEIMIVTPPQELIYLVGRWLCLICLVDLGHDFCQSEGSPARVCVRPQ